MRRHVVSIFGVFVALFLLAGPVTAASTPDGFIRTVGDKAFLSLGENGLSEKERTKRFRDLLNEAFDLPRIGRFVLGRYWRVATDEQRAEYLALFEKFVIQAYVNRFQDLTDKKLNVIRANELSGKETLVLSEIEIPGKPPVNVNWKVRNMDSGFKIVDVTVEGVSMSITQRDEFAAVIKQSGGKIDGLIRALRKKTSDD